MPDPDKLLRRGGTSVSNVYLLSRDELDRRRTDAGGRDALSVRQLHQRATFFQASEVAHLGYETPLEVVDIYGIDESEVVSVDVCAHCAEVEEAPPYIHSVWPCATERARRCEERA